MNEINIAQIMGFVGLFFTVIAFQFNSRSAITYLRTIGNVMFAYHFYLLGALTGMAANLVNVPRNILFLQNEKYIWAKHKYWPIFFALLYIVTGLMSWHGIISLLPIMANGFGVFSVWENDTKKIRFVYLLSSLLWLIYDILVKSYAGTISALIIIISVIIGIVRFDRSVKQS